MPSVGDFWVCPVCAELHRFTGRIVGCVIEIAGGEARGASIAELFVRPAGLEELGELARDLRLLLLAQRRRILARRRPEPPPVSSLALGPVPARPVLEPDAVLPPRPPGLERPVRRPDDPIRPRRRRRRAR